MEGAAVEIRQARALWHGIDRHCDPTQPQSGDSRKLPLQSRRSISNDQPVSRCRFRLCLPPAITTTRADPPPASPEPSAKQVVIISFDSAHDIAQWQRSRALAARTGAHFTYFLSCVFLLSPETRKRYTGAAAKPPDSRMSASPNPGRKSRQGWRRSGWPRPKGHEIASHACGHFDGKALEQGRLADRIRRLLTHVLRECLCDQRHCARTAGLEGLRRNQRSSASARPIWRRARVFTRRCRRRVFSTMPAAFRADRPCLRPATASPAFALPQIAEGPKATTGDRHGLQSVRAPFRRRRASRTRVVEFEDRAYRRIPLRLRRAISGRAHPAATRLPLHADERRRLLARAGTLCRRRLREGRCRLHQLFRLRVATSRASRPARRTAEPLADSHRHSGRVALAVLRG